MKILTGHLLVLIVLAFTSCEKPKQENLPNSQSGKYIKLDGGSAAVGGDQTPLLSDSEPGFNVPLKKQIPIRSA
jgi:hypothetical protein